MRRLFVVFGLVTAGALFGALAAMLLVGGLFTWGALTEPVPDALGVYIDIAPLAAMVGAPLGAALAPAAALTFLRHVPLWRLFLEPTLGAAVGGALGLASSGHFALVLAFGAAGALGAGARLGRAAARTLPVRPS